MSKPVAVLSSNSHRTIDWMKENYNIAQVNTTLRQLISKEGIVYIIIQTFEQARAWEFSGYLIAPDYESLLDLVRTRVR